MKRWNKLNCIIFLFEQGLQLEVVRYGVRRHRSYSRAKMGRRRRNKKSKTAEWGWSIKFQRWWPQWPGCPATTSRSCHPSSSSTTNTNSSRGTPSSRHRPTMPVRVQRACIIPPTLRAEATGRPSNNWDSSSSSYNNSSSSTTRCRVSLGVTTGIIQTPLVSASSLFSDIEKGVKNSPTELKQATARDLLNTNHLRNNSQTGGR